MRTLIIYDNKVIAEQISVGSFKKSDDVILFPLTSSAEVADRLGGLSREVGFSLRIVETARLVNAAADQLRGQYLDFIANLGLDVRHDGKNLREWFAVDDVASMWWMSLVAEKNTFKSNAFNALAQCDAIITEINRLDMRSVIIGIDNPKLVAVLSAYCRKKDIACTYWPMRAGGSWRNRIKEHQGFPLIKHVLHLLVFVGASFLRTSKIQRAFKPYKRRLNDPDQFMLMNAFPYLDLSSAQEGVFRNKQYAQLQVALEEKKQKVLWAVFYVNNETISFEDALQLAKKFIENGHNIYFIEEGCSFGMQIKVLAKLLIQSFKFFAVESKVAKRHQWKGYDFYPILKNEWYRSFIGPEGYQALLYYAMFQDLLKKVTAQKGLYCCEMQSWEKALIFAKKKVKNPVPLLAYQHTTVSYMLLNYFTTPTEINSNGRYAMAQPDKLICNGSITYEYMKKSGWSQERLAMAEAVRFDEFKKYLHPAGRDKKDIVLLALSISVEESSSLLNVVLDAFKGERDTEVWVKPHPFVKLEQVLASLCLSSGACPFAVKSEPVEELLKIARAVVVGESSVSLQALLYGCEVIIVNVPEWINMSPLKGFHLPRIHEVNSSRELREKAGSILTAKFDPDVCVDETNALVNKFFCLNADSENPYRFMELLGV